MGINCLNALAPEGAIVVGITSCDCRFVIAGPWLGFGCHVVGWCQIGCQSGHLHWGPSHNRRKARAFLSGIVERLHRRETSESWVVRAAYATLVYRLDPRSARYVCVCGCTQWVGSHPILALCTAICHARFTALGQRPVMGTFLFLFCHFTAAPR